MHGRSWACFAANCLAGTILTASTILTPACVHDHAVTRLEGVDLDGRPVNLLGDDRAKGVVLIFAKTDCPISNRYAPEIHRLHEKFSTKGFVFWLVYCDHDETPETIRTHAREYDYRMGILRDPGHRLVRATGVSVTPEAAVLVLRKSRADLVYRGRIDDRYLDFGRMRSVPTVTDLERALEAILEDRAPRRTRTQAIGCFIEETSPRRR